MRFVSSDSSGAPSRHRLFSALVGALRIQIPTVPAKHFKEGVFLATGGAVWFEAERPAAGGGLIEGASLSLANGHKTVCWRMRLPSRASTEN